MPDEADIVEVAAEAAEAEVFETYDRSDVPDLDVTVSFVEGTLSVDVYLDAVGDAPDEGPVADDATEAAVAAVDALLEDESSR